MGGSSYNALPLFLGPCSVGWVGEWGGGGTPQMAPRVPTNTLLLTKTVAVRSEARRSDYLERRGIGCHSNSLSTFGVFFSSFHEAR